MAPMRMNNRKKTQSTLRTLLRGNVAGLTALAAAANMGCVQDDTTESSFERTAEQCRVENNQLANDFYGNDSEQYATTMTAGAALNIHTSCNADSTYRWESPY